jgi:uncharacterized glyoxalase superfamily protein PhnB
VRTGSHFSKTRAADPPSLRIMSTQNIFPALRYRDADAALAWLIEAFGTEKRDVYRDGDGRIRHAELKLGDGLIMSGSYHEDGFLGASRPDPRAGTISLYIAIGDPDAVHAQATRAGAEVVRELTDTDYGSREFSVRDLEGNLWSFGSHSSSSPLRAVRPLR